MKSKLIELINEYDTTDTTAEELADRIIKLEDKAMNNEVEKINEMIGGNPYDERIFPTTPEQATKLERDKGFTDREITAISGCLARLGWNNAILRIAELGWRPPVEVPQDRVEAVKEILINTCLHWQNGDEEYMYGAIKRICQLFSDNTPKKE